MRGERVIQILDTAEHELYRSGEYTLREGSDSCRRAYFDRVALIREKSAPGVHSAARRVVAPFNEKQIAVVTEFRRRRR